MTRLLAAGLGAALPLSFAPFGWWPLGLVSVGGLYWLLASPGARAPASLGWYYGLGKYGVGVSWVYVSIHVYGQASPPLAGFLVGLFVAGMALFPMAQAWCFARLRGRGWVANALVFAMVWYLFEWLLTWFLTGFPWLDPGYAHIATPLAGWAPVGGVGLVGFMLVASAAFAAAALAGTNRIVAGALALVPWAGGVLLGLITWVVPGESRSVALVQGNVAQEVKWVAARAPEIVRRYLDLTEPYWGHALIVWPEAAIPLFEHQAGDVLAWLDTEGMRTGSSVVLGIPTVTRTPDGEYQVFNSAIARGHGKGRYDKRRLVPFGDYVPMQEVLRGAIEFFDLPMSNAHPGAWHQGPLRAGTETLAVAICYEVAYGSLMRDVAGAADVLVTISNDTWFGKSIGPFQHMAIARMRALENGRWMLRATNSGITGIVDHTGRLVRQLPQFEEAVLTGQFRIMAGETPYGRHGDGLLVAAALLALGAAAFVRAWALIPGRRRGGGPHTT